jgi:hypothetical protein
LATPANKTVLVHCLILFERYPEYRAKRKAAGNPVKRKR